MDPSLPCAFTMLVVGSSGSGKSVFTRSLIRSGVLSNHPGRVIWCYGANGSLVDESPLTRGWSYHPGLPTQEMLDAGNAVLVLDDLMDTAKNSSLISDIFTKYSHHNNITCIVLMQNLFPKGSEMRNISLNANYIVLMKNSRDRAQIHHLARQVYPGKSQFLVKAYEDATKDPFSYLFLDFKNTTPDSMRVRSGLLPGDNMFVYSPV